MMPGPSGPGIMLSAWSCTRSPWWARRSRACARSRRCGAKASTAASCSSAPSPTSRTTGRRCRSSSSRASPSPTQLALRKLPYDELDLELRLGTRAASPRPRARAALALDSGDQLAFDGLVHRDRLVAAHAARHARPRRDLRAAHARRRARDPRHARRPTQGRRGRRGLHRLGGRGDVPRPRPRRHRARGAAGAARARARRRCSARCAASCTATTASTCGSVSASPASTGHDRVERVRLDDGTAIDADVVVVGVGVVPVTDWLEGSGLTIDNGVVCDATLLAAPGVVSRRRHHAVAQPALRRRADAARALDERDGAGRRRGAPPALRRRRRARARSRRCRSSGPTSTTARSRPSGSFRGDDEMVVVHGSLDERRFVAVFGRDGRLVGALGFSMPAKVMQYRRMIDERVTFADALEHARAACVTVAPRHQRLPTEDRVGSSRTCYELWRRLPPSETTVLTTEFRGRQEWDAVRGSASCARRSRSSASDAVARAAASTRSRARSVPT